VLLVLVLVLRLLVVVVGLVGIGMPWVEVVLMRVVDAGGREKRLGMEGVEVGSVEGHRETVRGVERLAGEAQAYIRRDYTEMSASLLLIEQRKQPTMLQEHARVVPNKVSPDGRDVSVVAHPASCRWRSSSTACRSLALTGADLSSPLDPIPLQPRFEESGILG
jgi:hypothetical protein